MKAAKEKDGEEKEKEKEPFGDKLLKSRTVLLSRPVDDKMVEQCAAQLLVMEQDSDKDPIYVYINSPGGSADSGFALFDLLTFISPKVVTVCNGICASAAIMIYLGGTPGMRFSLPNSRFLLHQPSTQAQGTASDLQITAKEIIKIRQRYNEIVGKETGKKIDEVTADSARDFWLSPKEAKDYGLVDKVIKDRSEIKNLK